MSFDRFLIMLQGASSSWWQHLHNQHHSKPNVVSLLLALVYTVSGSCLMLNGMCMA